MQTLGHVAMVVKDYDEAIAFFTETLNFHLVEDTIVGESKRWVLISPPGSPGTTLLLAKASTAEQISRIGKQTGGRVFYFFTPTISGADYSQMSARGVKFTRPPCEEAYGTVAVFEDLHGNKWDLLQLKATPLAEAIP